MSDKFNPLEKKVFKYLVAGMGTSVVLTAAECIYILPQKPFWSGEEVATGIIVSVLPTFIGAIPMVYHAAKGMCKDIKEYGFFPRI